MNARPTSDEIADMWLALELRSRATNAPDLEPWLAAIRDLYCNGGAELIRLEVPEHPVFDWFVSSGRLTDILGGFVTSPIALQLAPDLMEEAVDPELQPRGLPLTLAGELARRLTGGGAYNDFAGTPADAMRLAQQFCRGLFAERYDDVTLYESDRSWSGWFHDLVWDATYVLFDHRDRQLWVLALTDAD